MAGRISTCRGLRSRPNEQVLRALYHKPARTRPPLGKSPPFSTMTASRCAQRGRTHRACGHREPPSDMDGPIFSIACRRHVAEDIRDIPPTDPELAPQFLTSVERLRPYRDELSAFCATLLGTRATGWISSIDSMSSLERVVTATLQHERRRFRDDAETRTWGSLPTNSCSTASPSCCASTSTNRLVACCVLSTFARGTKERY